jgi:hypothetical protein
MSLDYLKESHRIRVINILSKNISDEDKLRLLKVHLVSEPYFRTFGYDPAWLTRRIFEDFKKTGDENGKF